LESLKRGACGQQVVDLQCALAEAGLLGGDIDGWFGADTEKGVRLLQAKAKLAVSGVLDVAGAAAAGVTFTKPVERAALPELRAEALTAIFPKARLEDLALNLPYVGNALVGAGLGGREWIAMALATVRAEASAFLPVSEQRSIYNSSANGKAFDLYDNRVELGNGSAPDGALYRGRGFIQLTGRANYWKAGQAMGLGNGLVSRPLLAHQPGMAARLLAWFLKSKSMRIERSLRAGDLAEARRVVNGGTHGLDVFAAAYTALLKALPPEVKPEWTRRAA
jgi:putative chitinase